MGVIIPQVVTSDRASGAQVINGSLKFDSVLKHHLEKDFSSDGNRRTWTWSSWVKKSEDEGFSDDGVIFEARIDSPSVDADIFGIRWRTNGRIIVYDTGNSYVQGTREFRDTSAFYHLVLSVDTTQASNNISLYVNGDLYLQGSYTQNSDTRVNSSAATHRIGARTTVGSQDGHFLSSQISQCYFIDGQALGPENFGFTDPLTNTWKPKKYEGDFGTNGFWLPFDGSAPIGQDQSGQGNVWTPVNFGGSVALDSPAVSGARPILNTTQGGTQAGVGVFGSKQNVGYAVTVYNSGGGNKYYLDGVEAPTLTGLIRGATYTFDQSDSTNSTHPLVFGTTAEGNNFNDTAVTGASAGSAGAATTITIPYDGPNTIYYHCSAHSGMGADITGITTNEKLADQYASHVTLAAPLVGAAGDVSVSIACTSTPKTATVTNANSSSTQSNFYSGSFDFDGSGDYISYGTSSEMDFGSGDCTVECWLYINSHAGDKTIVGSWEGNISWQLSYGTTGDQNRFSFMMYNGATTSADSSEISTNYAGQWVHLAGVRNGNELQIWVNGKKDGTASFSGAHNSLNSAIRIGGRSSGNQTNAHIQDVRIYKGVAKYTDNFVVPSRSPDILPDTPSGVSGSSKLAKITDGAVSFDGTGDYLNTAWSSDFAFGTGDFTIEMFVYWQGDTSTSTVLAWGEDIDNRFDIGCQTANQIRVFARTGGSTFVNMDVANGISTNKWIHLAVVRNSSAQTMKLYIDGVEKASTSSVTATMPTNTSNGIDIGRRRYASSTSDNYQGFISNLRIIKGTALYTSNFTPPAAPLTNVTNTKLLCCQSNTSATEAAVIPTGSITANGNAAATNFNPFITDINAVRGQESGYATWNPLESNLTLSNGNLSVTAPSGNTGTRSNITISSGKWFWEYTVGSVVTNSYIGVTQYLDASGLSGDNYVLHGTGGNNYNTNTGGSWSIINANFTTGMIIGCAFDYDGGNIYIYKDGALAATFSGGNFAQFDDWKAHISFNAAVTTSWETNFGQKPFKFPPPDGYQPLNIANTRPVKVISRPDQYVGIVTYASDGNAQTISGLNFQPDLVWQKQTTSGDSDRHFLTDSVRGAGTALRSDSTAADASADAVASFTSDGWTIGSGSGNANQNTKSYVAWAWKAGGSGGGQSFWKDDVGYATAAAAGITGLDGTNQMTTAKYLGCSIGTKQGFSIIKYNGLGGSNDVAIPHGLSQSPDLVIVKNLTDTISWAVAHSGFVDNRELHLDTDESSTNVAFLGLYKSNFTSTSFAVNYSASNLNYVNASGKDYIAYVWHNVPGLQKFGFYKGNQNADGVYVELGFRPKLVWIKAVSVGGSGYSWYIHDSERSKFNPTTLDLKADSNANNVTTTRFDFLSNGFKIRGANLDMNDSGERFIYCAWAEAPSVDLFGGGANAR